MNINEYDSECVVVVNGFAHWHTVKHVYLSLYIFKFIHVGMHRFGKPALINYHILMCINNGVLALTVAP